MAFLPFKTFTLPTDGSTGQIGDDFLNNLVDNKALLSANFPGEPAGENGGTLILNLSTNVVGTWSGPPPSIAPGWGLPDLIRADGTWYSEYEPTPGVLELTISDSSGNSIFYANLGVYGPGAEIFGRNTNVNWLGVRYNAWLVGDLSDSGGASVNLYVFDGNGDVKLLSHFPLPGWFTTDLNFNGGRPPDGRCPIGFDPVGGNFYVNAYDTLEFGNWTLYKVNIDSGEIISSTQNSTLASLVYDIWIDSPRRVVLGLRGDGGIQVINLADGSLGKIVPNITTPFTEDSFDSLDSDYLNYMMQGLADPLSNVFFVASPLSDQPDEAAVRRVCAASISVIDDTVIPQAWGLESRIISRGSVFSVRPIFYSPDNAILLLGDPLAGTDNSVFQTLFELYFPATQCGNQQQPRITIHR